MKNGTDWHVPLHRLIIGKPPHADCSAFGGRLSRELEVKGIGDLGARAACRRGGALDAPLRVASSLR